MGASGAGGGASGGDEERTDSTKAKIKASTNVKVEWTAGWREHRARKGHTGACVPSATEHYAAPCRIRGGLRRTRRSSSAHVQKHTPEPAASACVVHYGRSSPSLGASHSRQVRRYSFFRGASPSYDCFRRIPPVAAYSGDRLLSEPTAGTQPRRREPLFMPEHGHSKSAAVARQAQRTFG